MPSEHPRNSRGIALVQLLLGVFGLLLCGYLYLQYCQRMQDSLDQLDGLAGDAIIQAQVGSDLLTDWSSLLKNVDSSITTHQKSLVAIKSTTEQASRSVESWRRGLDGFSEISKDTSRVFDRLASQLPLKIPKVAYGTRQLSFEVPDLKVKREQIKIPYPTAKVGSRKVELDVGLTDLKFDVPTLDVGSSSRSILVPTEANVTRRKETITVPDDVRVEYTEILRAERDLLHDTASQLQEASATLAASSKTLESVEGLIETKLASSIDETLSSIQLAKASAQRSHEKEIPRFKEKLRSQVERLTVSQSHLRRIEVNSSLALRLCRPASGWNLSSRLLELASRQIEF